MTPADKKYLEDVIKKMKDASDVFYMFASSTNFHQFLELNGLIVEYIHICEYALKDGIDFTQTHKLPLKDYNYKYINEKLDCIFAGDIVLEKSL